MIKPDFGVDAHVATQGRNARVAIYPKAATTESNQAMAAMPKTKCGKYNLRKRAAVRWIMSNPPLFIKTL